MRILTFILVLTLSVNCFAQEKTDCVKAAEIACASKISESCEQRMVSACVRITQVDASQDPGYSALVEITRNYCKLKLYLIYPKVYF